MIKNHIYKNYIKCKCITKEMFWWFLFNVIDTSSWGASKPTIKEFYNEAIKEYNNIISNK